MGPDAWTELEDDGTIEEQFDDINRGQTHRAKLMSDPEIRRAHGIIDGEIILRRHHADNSGRAQGGGRGGRGGGVAGSRSRVSGLKRYVTAVKVNIHAYSGVQSSHRNCSNRHPKS